MAEAARRLDREGGDVVHRLIARPIRLEYSQHARPASEPASDADEAEEADVADEADTLRAELDLLKAILKAERAEAAQLRSRLASGPGASAADVAAMRARWAELFDRMLLAPR